MAFSLRTIWRPGSVVGPRYVKFDNTGALINVDKFSNYRNYYWTGVTLTPTDLPIFNTAGLAEYYVVEKGGTSLWSTFNFWTHVSDLKAADLKKYHQAIKPIIEFNKGLESELVYNKTVFGQLPQFKLWRRTDDNLYEFEDGQVENLHDEYAQKHLLVDLADLPDVNEAVKNDEQLLSQTFVHAGRRYIQSLFNASYQDTVGGVTYPYKALIVKSPVSDSNGSLLSLTATANAVPQVITLTWNTATNAFKLYGTVSQDGPDVTIGSTINFAGVAFKASSGPLENGDKYVIQVKSPYYQREFLYVAVNGAPRTLSSPNKILDQADDFRLVKGDVNLTNGVWEVPPQLKWNIQNETRSQISQGDLYYHFTSIIDDQLNLNGSPTGENNWREISQDVGLGGKIKQYDNDAALLVSTLLQEGITHPSLIEFAKQSYRSLFVELKLFIEDELPTLIVNGDFNPGATIVDAELLELFKQYLSKRSEVVTSSSTVLDDNLATTFYDSTSSISNLVVTLPYLGLASLVQPSVELDLELNLPMLVHHDGHKSEITQVEDEVLKRLVQKKFLRSSGQETTGTISGFSEPSKPFRGQFWYKTATKQLFFYDVISDTGELPESAQLNDYSFDRQTDKIYKFNGTTWILQGSTPTNVALPWRVLDLTQVMTQLSLAVETELYDNCPTIPSPINTTVLESNSLFTNLMKREFEAFGVYYGVSDVYGAVYDPSNPFTWNYTSSFGVATWHVYYEQQYGTSRPDIQPWIPAGYASESALMADLVTEGLVPSGTTTWNTSYWSNSYTFLRTKYVENSKPSKLSVSVLSGDLLPPFDSLSPEAFISVPPTSAATSFVFGDNGPVELLWTRTLDYLYSLQKVYFKLDPFNYVQATWGFKNETQDGYTFNSQLSKKAASADLQLHGDSFKHPEVVVNCTNITSQDLVYTVKCVSRLHNIFKITGGNLISHEFFNAGDTWTDGNVTIEFPISNNYFVGDIVTITANSDSSVMTRWNLVNNLFMEGFSQLYVQYLRNYGQDRDVSLNKTLFNDWSVKIGYRFDSLINTDLLKVKVDNSEIAKSSYEVLIKENKLTRSTWLNSIKVTLALKGSSDLQKGVQVPKAQPGGIPGADWLFRIDVYNSARPLLTWYSFDQNGPVDTFTALDGSNTNYSWSRYLNKTTLNSMSAPFMIKGLQNVVNFIFGYSDKLEEDGWHFNDQDTSVFDDQTGRAVTYQLLVEKFLDLIYQGPDEGIAFTFNPFYRKVWFESNRGVVTALNEIIGIEQETIPKLLDVGNRQISLNDVRVFRQDEMTEFVFDQNAYTFHLLTSEYEHVALFDNYSTGTTLFYDAFLGQSIDNIFLEGRKQRVPTGRLDFGGHYLLGGEMKRNIESSVSSITKLYETADTTAALPEVARARASLGFQHKGYFDLRNSTDQAEFRFWQGMISRKGTNYAVDAYINSSKYATASMDEFWAYKIADYGDARKGSQPEMRVALTDVVARGRTPYVFLEENEEANLINCGYEIRSFGTNSFDFYTIYSPEVAESVESYFDPRNTVIISATDEARWMSYNDLSSMQYIPLELIIESPLRNVEVGSLVTILGKDKKPVRADVFEVFNKITGQTYYERGEYNSDDESYGYPSFERINHSTIKILGPLGNGYDELPYDVDGYDTATVFVRAYGPPISSFSPSQLYNYSKNVLAKDDLIWWDPARGSHHPLAISQIDYTQNKDPASYNSVDTTHKRNNDKVWGVGEVGKIWWNDKGLEWQPYSDTKIYANNNDRLNRWGALAEHSSIELYEWISSDVPPNQYAGEIALTRLMQRRRTWQQRVVGWKYSANTMSPRKFLAYQPTPVQVEVDSLIFHMGRMSTYGLTVGTKIAGAIYGTTFDDAGLETLQGSLVITGTDKPILSSMLSATNGPTFIESPYFTFDTNLDNGTIEYFDDPSGEYILFEESDGIVMKHVSSGRYQRLEIVDTPVNAGRDTYSFDELGITIYVNSIFTHDEEWGSLGVTDSVIRKATVLAALVQDHELYIRFKAECKILSPGPMNEFGNIYGLANVNPGWVAWNDPTINPVTLTPPPNNQWEPFAGEWTAIGNHLNDLSDEIVTRIADPWVWFNGDNYVPYRYTWGQWQTVEAETRNVIVGSDEFDSLLTFSLSDHELRKRAHVYLNGVVLSTNQYVISDSKIDVESSKLILGYKITVIIDPEELTQTQLNFDPLISDDDPKIVDQYKIDSPYVMEERRVSGDAKSKVYYYWVKNKETPGINKKASLKRISHLLTYFDDSYCVPQVLKWADQLDGRPNRYATLYIENLGHYVKAENSYKMRFKSKPHLRNDDRDIDLKNVHEEWALIRPFQPTKIPQKLWDIATDTVAGVNSIGESLPNPSLSSYEERTGNVASIGPNRGQLLTDVESARTVVKYTILNTRVTKYENQELVSDFMNFIGFDINNVDAYLATSVSSRQLMADIWRNAKPKQINEIFFALLEDGISRNLEMPEFFKTSYIALNDVRTVAVEQTTVDENTSLNFVIPT